MAGLFYYEKLGINFKYYDTFDMKNFGERGLEYIAEKYGDEQVNIWRRSYDIAPPNGESLKDTAARVIPYFKAEIEPKLKEGKNIVVAAHGNSLRALIMYLENMTPQQILEFEIGTAIPRHYELDSDLKVLKAENL